MYMYVFMGIESLQDFNNGDIPHQCHQKNVVKDSNFHFHSLVTELLTKQPFLIIRAIAYYT